MILAPDEAEHCPVNALLVDNPHAAFARAAGLLYPVGRPEPGIHPSAVLGEDCHIAPDVAIGPHCSIGDGVTLAAGCVIGPGCVIERGV